MLLKSIPKTSVVRHCLVAPSMIHLLCFILEAYEGIASVTTVDSSLGLVQLNVPSGCEETLDRILEAEKERLRIRPIMANC